MTTLAEIENQAGVARITCGWKKTHLPLDWVRRYWRDVHSPAITRRAGIYDYRHYQFDSVRSDLFNHLVGVETACPRGEQLMWLSDVRYQDEVGLAEFDKSPTSDVKPHLLGDIELIVDKSTTYRALGANAHTYVDNTGIAAPQGPCNFPTFALFIRQRADEPSFRKFLHDMAKRWAGLDGVLRLRLNLFEVPDIEAERKAGYPVKTHPVAQQYQAWIDITLAHEQIAKSLLLAEDDIDYSSYISTIHAYQVLVVYTSVYGGRPTLVGLRGYAAYEAINALDAQNQRETALLDWMYGSIVKGGPLEVARK